MSTRFLDELAQMPAALDRLVSFYEHGGRERLRAFRQRATGIREIVCSGMGTSRFAPEAIFPRVERTGVSCRTMDAGEWLHYGSSVPADSRMVILTSQSGESIEVKRLVEEGLAPAGYVSITNNESSTLARSAGITFPLLAGEEASISTKTYAATLAVLHLLAAALEGEAAVESGLKDLREAARLLQDGPMDDIASAAAVLARGSGIAFVGRGPAYVTARQCALTFMEGTRGLAAAFTGGAFNHGPMESVQEGFSLVVFQPRGATHHLAESLARTAVDRGAAVVLLTDDPHVAVPGARIVAVPGRKGTGSAEELFPLLACRVQNLLLHQVAAARGTEAGMFRYGQKVTSRE